MQEPRCEKCGGWLNHEIKDDFWICKQCNRRYTYIESLPSSELRELQQLDNMAKDCAERMAYILQRITSIVQEFRHQSQKVDYFLQIQDELRNIEFKQQNGYALFNDSLHCTSELIKEMEIAFVPIGGGRFEPIKEMLI